MAQKEVGRPTKLTKELQDKICELLKWGNYIETAASYCGITKSTLYDWLKRGAREEEGIYVEFSNAVRQAEAEAEMRDIQNLFQASKSDWRVSAWRLERKYPKKWGRMERLED